MPCSQVNLAEQVHAPLGVLKGERSPSWLVRLLLRFTGPYVPRIAAALFEPIMWSMGQ